MKSKFNFDLYRLNVIDAEDLFLDLENRVRNDNQISEIIEKACSSDFDNEQETRGAKYKWSLRYFTNHGDLYPERKIITVTLARSILEKDGFIVTDDGISIGSSASYPPLASTMIIFFDMNRHLVAVEHSGELSQVAWKDFLQKIFSDAALSNGHSSVIELEPVPEKHKITSLFKSFEKITRIKVTLRIPNPELSRYTRNLYEDLRNSGVREYTQDMKNPNGLSKNENARPYASAALAEDGYKKGDIQIEGFRDDTFEKVTSGSTASRGSISSLKDFVRGISVNAKTKEAKKVLVEIAKEIDKIHPLDLESQND